MPDFDIAFQDFSPEADTEIKGTIELRLLGSCLRAKNDPQSVARVLDIFQPLYAPGDDACSLERVTSTCRHTADTMDITAEVVQYIVQKSLSTRKRDTVMTLAARLHCKGLMEGRQNVLQRQPAKRFGYSVLDIRVQERLRSATPQELEAWTVRILDAATIDDIFTISRTD